MEPTTSASCDIIDNTFGPHAGTCRGGFDFTLLFEETILVILPVVIILMVAPFRIFYLLKRRTKVTTSWLLISKLVSILPPLILDNGSWTDYWNPNEVILCCL